MRVPKEAGEYADVRTEMQTWLQQMGIEKITGEALELSDPPKSLLKQAKEENGILVVQPAGYTGTQLSELFHMTNWAAAGLDTVSSATVDVDEWFVTPAVDFAPYAGESPERVEKIATRDGKRGMSLEQYILFAARFKTLRGYYPDINHWTWLLQSHERALILFAGFDSHGNLQINSCTPDYVDDNTGCRLITVETFSAHYSI